MAKVDLKIPERPATGKRTQRRVVGHGSDDGGRRDRGLLPIASPDGDPAQPRGHVGAVHEAVHR